MLELLANCFSNMWLLCYSGLIFDFSVESLEHVKLSLLKGQIFLL